MRLSELHVSKYLQPRDTGLCRETVADYAAAVGRGDVFPPLLAYRVTDRKYPGPVLVAGFHRYEALKQAGVEEYEVEVREGTFSEAWLAGWRSNLTNGLRYTNAAKNEAVRKALTGLLPGQSTTAVAEALGVSQQFVSKVRKTLVAAGTITEPVTVTGKDGVEQPAIKSDISTTPVTTVVTGVVQESEQQVPEPEVHSEPEPEPVVVEASDPDPDEEHDAAEPLEWLDAGNDEPEPEPAPRVDGPSAPPRPHWMVPGGKPVDPDHPYAEVLKKFTALSAALTRVLRGEHGPALADALVEVGTHPHRIPLVAFTSDVIEGLEVKRGTVRFVGLYALRCLVNDVGNWKRERKAGQALKAFSKYLTEAEQVAGEGEE